ncbi:MAG: ribosomal RNA small subunit methyltransferase A, partial [Candidatus Lokiarchaeota archaeon]|nr:ribosomal RNA small subunit methyltransferase A [Candidatus Lokiarchaeota archaeon]
RKLHITENLTNLFDQNACNLSILRKGSTQTKQTNEKRIRLKIKDLKESNRKLEDKIDVFSKNKVKSCLKKWSIHPKKDLGQHFLIDKKIIHKEINVGSVTKFDSVLEIGPGVGNLTQVLARFAGKVIAIEKDSSFKAILANVQKLHTNLKVVYGDFFNVKKPKVTKIIANLPYNIALPVLFEILKLDIKMAVLIIQERLAKRITVTVGHRGYSRISVQISRHADVSIIERVPNSSFFPEPSVENSMILIKKIKVKFDVPSEDFFSQILKYFFLKRDETIGRLIKRLLMNVNAENQFTTQIKNKIGSKILRKKVYRVSPNQFGKITNILWKALNQNTIFLNFLKKF